MMNIRAFWSTEYRYLNAAMNQGEHDYSPTQQGFVFDAETGSFQSTACEASSKHCLLVLAS
eukprot:COSAG05_NODE_7640_length_786_cov_1.069869_1_plen_60_part_10